MNLKLPLNNCTITQKFGKNANTYYLEDGLKGHTGLDLVSFYGDTVRAAVDGPCYSVINKNNPDPMKYRAVFQLIEDNGIFYEVSYGHLNEIYVSPGDILKTGNLIGTEGNTGDVASGGVKITKEMKENGSGAGAHVHFQVRSARKVDSYKKGRHYLYNGSTSYVNGFYYEVIDYDNGYKGCIDPEQFIEQQKQCITQTLKRGSMGEQVKILQNVVAVNPDGVFGRHTEEAVKTFQQLHNLKPDGIVGPITRSLINNLI